MHSLTPRNLLMHRSLSMGARQKGYSMATLSGNAFVVEAVRSGVLQSLHISARPGTCCKTVFYTARRVECAPAQELPSALSPPVRPLPVEPAAPRPHHFSVPATPPEPPTAPSCALLWPPPGAPAALSVLMCFLLDIRGTIAVVSHTECLGTPPPCLAAAEANFCSIR